MVNKKEDFLGSRAEGETEIEHAVREAQWKEDHSCSLCGNFECDGSCEDFIDAHGYGESMGNGLGE